VAAVIASDAGSPLERALVVYVGAQKCYVAMYKDLPRGLRSPVLAYVSPAILEQGRSGKIVVGDDVLVLPMRNAFKVTSALPRRNLFQRNDGEGRPRALAANLGVLRGIASSSSCQSSDGCPACLLACQAVTRHPVQIKCSCAARSAARRFRRSS